MPYHDWDISCLLHYNMQVLSVLLRNKCLVQGIVREHNDEGSKIGAPFLINVSL